MPQLFYNVTWLIYVYNLVLAVKNLDMETKTLFYNVVSLLSYTVTQEV